MLTIGFTNKFYTLWDVSEPNTVWTGANSFYVSQNFNYRKNLSFDLVQAELKLKGKKYAIDLSLRGSHSWVKKSAIQYVWEPWQFTFGKLSGMDIRDSEDVWQLERAMQQEKNPRTRVYARRRLIGLGELVKHVWTENVTTVNPDWKHTGEDSDYTTKYQHVSVRRKYATKAQLEIEQQKKLKTEMLNGHFFNNGEKIEIELTQVANFSFEGSYGRVYVVTYLDDKKQVFKYVGASPTNTQPETKCKVKATVKHTVYNDQKETHLQRMKVI